MALRRTPGRAAALALGVPGLDEVLGRALEPGASMALSGPPQTGKTWLAVQFALAGAAQGDSVLLIPEAVVAQSQS